MDWEINLSALKESCLSGTPPPLRRLKRLSEAPADTFKGDQLAFLEEWLDVQKVGETAFIMILRCLTRFGNPVSRYIDRLPKEATSYIVHAVCNIAKSQDDPDTILMVTSGDSRLYANFAMITLKKMGRTEYLTTYMLSTDKSVSTLAQNLVEMKDDNNKAPIPAV